MQKYGLMTMTAHHTTGRGPLTGLVLPSDRVCTGSPRSSPCGNGQQIGKKVFPDSGQAVIGSASVPWIGRFLQQLELDKPFEALSQYGATNFQNVKKLVMAVEAQGQCSNQKHRPAVIDDSKNIPFHLVIAIGTRNAPSMIPNAARYARRGPMGDECRDIVQCQKL